MTAPRRTDCNTNDSKLFMALELSNSKWTLAFSRGPGARARRRDVPAGQWSLVLKEVQRAKAHLDLPEGTLVVSCYEAGRDGFWLHRCLCHHGIENMVVDSSSIEVNRRRRRAKTDRLDAEKLLSMLMRWANGEQTVWSVINPPTPEEEDARQLHRELDVLKREQTRHSNRIKGLLAGIGVEIPVDRNFPQQLQKAEQWDGSPVPDGLRCRLFREFERMQLLNRQIRQLEQQRADRIRKQEANPTVEKVRRLLRLRALGPASSWLFVHEVFGWREVQNRRQLASLLGLVPTPYNSGNSQRDQGISKSGNQRMRTMAIEIAWCWVRFQPDSRLSRWYMQRFGGGSRRQRRIGIVALARKLMVAIWKYLKEGEIPDGARMQDGPSYHFSYTPSLS